MVKACIKQEGANAEEKTLHWGDLTVYEFDNLLGDNPSVSSGAPLTIGWKHNRKSVASVDAYELFLVSNPRRSRKKMRMSKSKRDR
jgi:hypothetical protein